MKLTQIATGVAIAMAASVASADYVKIGFDENEIYVNEADGDNKDNYNTYVGFGFTPMDGSPLTISGSGSNRVYDSPDKRGFMDMPTSNPNGNSGDYTRQQIYISYPYSSGDFSFNPKMGVRRDDFVGARDIEYRFYFDTSYKVSDAVTVYLNPFLNTWTRTYDGDGDDTNGTASGERDHLDYEILTGVKYKFGSDQYINAAVFYGNEDAKDDNTTLKYWQARLAYGQSISDALSMEVFSRYDLDRKNETEGVGEKEEKEWRLGVSANYVINQDWSVNGVVWYNTADKTDYDGSNLDDTSDKYVYSLFVKRSF